MTNQQTATRFIASFLLALFVTPCAQAQRIHPNLKSGKVTPQRLVILPADVAMVKDGMKGGEPMEKEAAEAKPVIEQAINKAFVKKQFNVIESPFTPAALQENEKLKYALADLKRNFATLQVQLNRKKKDVEKGRFTLGDQVLMLNQDDNIDAFVFVQALGVKKTGGKKALALVTLSPLMMLPVYTVSLTVVDARTGDILALNDLYTVLDITKADDKKLVELVERGFKKLLAPKAAAPPKA